MTIIPAYGQWFPEARYGLFIHWGPYAAYGRGEQVLFREHLDQQGYAYAACQWNPPHFDARAWADAAVRGGFKYAVLTTRHHDGFCLWDSKQTDYSSAAQAAKRDFVAEYVAAFREAGLKVGLYYSLADWRVPAYFSGPTVDPEGWAMFQAYVHAQVRELMTNYGKIDELWFDGAWPRSKEEWKSRELVAMIRELQPDILINNRLGSDGPSANEEAAGASALGDFGTPEHHITADKERLWESCQTSTWRLWGDTFGERWRPADLLLDMLMESCEKGGNLLLNVGPTSDGRIPADFLARSQEIGKWLHVHGEAVYGANAADIARAPKANAVTECVTYGRQIVKKNSLYLIFRFWDGLGEFRLAGLETRVKSATLLTTGQALGISQSGDTLHLSGLPRERPTMLFPVIRLDCDGPPQPAAWAKERLWSGDTRPMADWARTRGTSVWADGQER